MQKQLRYFTEKSKKFTYEKDDLLIMKTSFHLGYTDAVYWKVLSLRADDNGCTHIKCFNLLNSEEVEFPMLFMEKLFDNYGKADETTMKVLYGCKSKDSKN